MLARYSVTSRVSGNALAFLICLERQATHVAECQVVGPCERGEAITNAMLRSHARLHPREKRRVKTIVREHTKRLLQSRAEKSRHVSEPYAGTCPECGEVSLCRDTYHGVQCPLGPQHERSCSLWREHAPACSCAYCKKHRPAEA
jgi:hypothetical protein